MRSDNLLDETSDDAASVREALLCRAYEGEIIGCAMYDRMVSDPAYPKKDALHLLYVVERITAEALEPLITRYHVAVDNESATREGHQLAAALSGQPWKDMWAKVIRLADDYLSDFRRLADVLDGDDAAVGRQVVEHEEALIAFANREIADALDPLAPLVEYQRRYAR
ncbi:hypothetical protein A5784_02985 [Mycobacterium sp. 852013-50091_SCH5140682]|uniref:hypothetical protein n=1 Tax=Mycobacterium sp. 852013-50091_SCH5140682 TaxID=1834109 RepID=UPI0007EA08FA|nr:hypothetical protein [Mycobacterium sp. 852013-50091_SCH5140682]OBC15391.1 hypothetical protein A5784_02985 [Mycobacterium sp. 852013-50091_SCH5140682]